MSTITSIEMVDLLGNIEKGSLKKLLTSSFEKNSLNVSFFKSSQTGNEIFIKNLNQGKDVETIQNQRSEENIYFLENTDLKGEKKNFLIFNLPDLSENEISQKEKIPFTIGIATSDVFIFNFPWFHFQVENSIGYRKVRSIISTIKEMGSDGIIPTERPKTFVFILRDFDLEGIESSTQKEVIEKNLKLEISSKLKTSLNDTETNFFFLPHSIRKPNEFSKASELVSNFLVSQKVPKKNEEVETLLEKISKFSSKKPSIKPGFNDKEMIAYAICNEIYLKNLDLFKQSIEPWKICCEEGGIIQNFGKEADKLIQEFIEKFEKDTEIFQETKTFSSKRNILGFNLVSSLQKIFEKQIYKLKELSFQSFKEALSSIQVTGDVEHQVNGAIQITEKYFITKVEALKPPQAKRIWSSEKERKELVNGIREMATERLQAARLQGVYLKKTKNPISLSFYYLHPHPFGKDLRLDHMTLNDSLGYNPDLTKRAGLMRQFVATRGDSKKVSSDIETNTQEEDFIYQEEPMKSFQNNSR